MKRIKANQIFFRLNLSALILSLNIAPSFSAKLSECSTELGEIEFQELNIKAWIEQTIASDKSSSDKIAEFHKLISLPIIAETRSYPQGMTVTKRDKISGVVKAVSILDHQKNLFEMQILISSGEVKKILFSSSISPSFSKIAVHKPLAALIASAADLANASYTYPHDILSVGIDTPKITADYKNSLRDRNAIAFYGKASPFYEFSNFYIAPIVIEGKVWPTSEHYFQAKKFEGTIYEEKVRLAATCAEAAAMGRDRKLPLRADWEKVKDAIMKQALIAKFTQHPNLMDILLSTGDRYLVEHTERDRYWGDNEDGTGKRMLGNLLMELRSELRDEKMKSKYLEQNRIEINKLKK